MNVVLKFLDDVFDKLKDILLPPLAYLILKLINITISYEVENEAELKKVTANNAVIIALWHDQLWYPSYYLKNRNYIALADISRLGDCIAYALEKSGFKLVRGSTSKGGSASLRKLLRNLKQQETLTITPDGPRGPRHKTKPGIVYLGKKTDSLIVPLGVAFKKKWQLNTWDNFQIPYPFTKAKLVFGQPFSLDAADKLEQNQKLIEEKINLVNHKANQLLKE